MSSPPPSPPHRWQPQDRKDQQAKQVSLRGASAREISRDALLQKVSQERELRNYTRRASAAALTIQRVLRRYLLMRKVAQQLQAEWEALVFHHNHGATSEFISSCLLRPFLFFTSYWKLAKSFLHPSDLKCVTKCFEIVLQNINSPDKDKNFCFLTVGRESERSTWLFQTQKLVSLCSFLLFECACMSRNEYTSLTSLGTRLAVTLTDPTNWKCFNANNIKDSGNTYKRLLMHMVTGKSSLYIRIRKHLLRYEATGYGIQGTLHKQLNGATEENFLITASAITLALRPFHIKKSGLCDLTDLELMLAAEVYCKYILTIPSLAQRLPLVLLPALKHESSLAPCLQVLLISMVKILSDLTRIEKLESSLAERIPPVGWLLANLTSLSVEFNAGSGDSGKFSRGLDFQLYIHVSVSLLKAFLNMLDGVKHTVAYKDCKNEDISPQSEYSDSNFTELYSGAESTYLNQLKAVHQQWFLRELIADAEKNAGTGMENLKLLDIAVFYSYVIRLYCRLSPLAASLPILNMLSFTPGFLLLLWKELANHLSNWSLPGFGYSEFSRDDNNQNNNGKALDKKQKGRDTGDKWFHILQKITGKSTDADCSDLQNRSVGPIWTANNAFDFDEMEPLKPGFQGISGDLVALMHLFFAAYSHLLLVLDDIEFYEKQVPFTLEQQQNIANMLNNFVYSSFLHNDQRNKFLLDSAIRCLHLLYERDCRRKFCPALLWVGPAQRGRLPVAAAARAHEAAFTHLRSGDIASSQISSIITTMPHVFPFEERVQMFREFVRQDKSSRRVAGEVDGPGPGPGSIEVIIRRSHIVEDGYRQLNSLGSRLKSSFNVSFVSESGLPEVGLDYGGLSKEFLTDLSKSAFDPQFGLFVQTSTPDRLLIPNVSAKFSENGVDMIEFLGRIVGKALYEGILLDYSFALAFIQKILGRYSFVDELSTLDPELYKNLMYVKHYEGDVEELALDFTVTEDMYGKRVTTELKPGGRNTLVTNENKLQYIYALSDYKLNRQILPLANAFFRGLSDLISPSWLRLFNANEFNELLSGGKHDFDVEDLKNNTKYSGGYSERSRTIKLFWEVVKGFAPDERCMLLKFVTSCSRAPLLGFKYLQPTFTIHKVACDVPLLAMVSGQDVDRLPSASTCYNTLKLPTYRRPNTLRNKLLYAISSNAGFELS